MTPLQPRRTILLLGGTGFLGTHLAVALHNAGYRVLLAGQRPHARDGQLAINLPLADPDAILDCVRKEQVDTVVHLACGLLPSSGEPDYLAELKRINVPLIRLARQLADVGTRLVFLSSGGTIYGPTATTYAAENDVCRPISLYGQAKLETELHLSFLERTCGLRLLTLRPSNPYGPFQLLRGAQGLVSAVLGRIANSEPLDIWGDGSVTRDYIHVEDAALAMAGLIGSDAEGVFNIGSGVGHSQIDVVRLVETTLGRSVELRFHPGRAADVPRLVLDVTRLAKAGLQHARPLAQGIRDYAAWLGMIHD